MKGGGKCGRADLDRWVVAIMLIGGATLSISHGSPSKLRDDTLPWVSLSNFNLQSNNSDIPKHPKKL